ncbi:hypothetical protein GBA52_007925 [Prunus armeniaca]|nr:hypothetical protein GBA52_007925 [Prunus armeniaca]
MYQCNEHGSNGCMWAAFSTFGPPSLLVGTPHSMDKSSTGHVLVARIWMVNIEHCAVPENLCIKTYGEDNCCGYNGIFPASCCGGYGACYFAHQPH